MSSAAYGEAESSRLSPNRLKRAVISAQSAPPIQTRSALSLGKAKAAASARPRCHLRGRVGWRVARNGSRSGQADHLHASLQLRRWHSVRLWPKTVTAIRTPRRGLPVSSYVMSRYLRHCCDWSGYASPAKCTGKREDGGLTRQAGILNSRAKRGTLEGRGEADGRGKMLLAGRNQAGAWWLQRREEARGWDQSRAQKLQ